MAVVFDNCFLCLFSVLTYSVTHAHNMAQANPALQLLLASVQPNEPLADLGDLQSCPIVGKVFPSRAIEGGNIRCQPLQAGARLHDFQTVQGTWRLQELTLPINLM